MKPSEFREQADFALKHRRRLLVVGPPGTGKSFIWEQACRAANWDFIPISMPLQSPVKIGGYPRAPKEEGGDATHALFDGMARAFRATRPTLLLLDDLGMCGGETLKAALDLVQFGRIDNRTLPDCVLVCACTNDVSHGADVQGLVEPMKNRWHSIINVSPDVDDLVIYGLGRNWPTWLLAYIKNDPTILGSWKPTKSMQPDGCTPRGLEYLAEWDNLGNENIEIWSGAVSKVIATKAQAFKRLQADLPDIDQCLLDPHGSAVPDNVSARYLICTAMSARMDGNTFGSAVTYLKRLPGPMRAFAITSALKAERTRRTEGTLPKGHKPMKDSRDFTAWAVSEDGKEVMMAIGG